MTTAQDVAQTNSNNQRPLGSHPGGDRARCSAEVDGAIVSTIFRQSRNYRIPPRTLVSGTRSDLERVHSLLAACRQPSSRCSPLVSIQLPRGPISAFLFLKTLCQALTGTAPNGSDRDILGQVQHSLYRQCVSIIAVAGLDEALAGQTSEAIDSFFESILPSLKPCGAGRGINIVITCSPTNIKTFAASDPLWQRWAFSHIEISEVKPDVGGTGDLTAFIAIGPNIWGKGQTLQQAREKMESIDGHEVDEYEIWHVHESCEVDELGNLLTEIGHSRPEKLYEISCGRW